MPWVATIEPGVPFGMSFLATSVGVGAFCETVARGRALTAAHPAAKTTTTPRKPPLSLHGDAEGGRQEAQQG
jgi:hypothetical protein